MNASDYIHLPALDRIAHGSHNPMLARYVEERAKGSTFEDVMGRSGMATSNRLASSFLLVGGTPCTTVNGSPVGTGWGRPTYRSGASASCPIKPPKCDCQVMGGNTLGGNQIGVASQDDRFGVVEMDSGESSAFVPHYMLIVAALVGDDADNVVTPGLVPVLLTDSKSGREPNMRRGSDSDPSYGVISTSFDDQHELVCVDWLQFSSIANQNLTMSFFNVNDTAVHVLVDLWGIPVAGRQ
jgi:hypothetical protein